jgi:hypothetical protein
MKLESGFIGIARNAPFPDRAVAGIARAFRFATHMLGKG